MATSASPFQVAEKAHPLCCFAIRKDGDCQPLLWSGPDSRSSEILTYDPVRCFAKRAEGASTARWTGAKRFPVSSFAAALLKPIRL
jgi:hypothetical protein